MLAKVTVIAMVANGCKICQYYQCPELPGSEGIRATQAAPQSRPAVHTAYIFYTV
jgi:hypothetical protein